jgi:hypothetical protein
MVGTQLYVITQISTYNYMFRPYILAIVRLYYKLNKSLYNMCVGYSGGTRSRLTVVGGMASGSSWTGVNIICQRLGN